MNKLVLILTILVVAAGTWMLQKPGSRKPTVLGESSPANEVTPAPLPLSISAMRDHTYPGSDLAIESNLPPTATYRSFIASYQSDGLKIKGLLTVPLGEKPAAGWPAIIFNHGYLDPQAYRTTARYGAYVDYFARQGYLVFKPDYRGHGESEGTPEGAYYSPAYTIDVLNAVASVKRYPEADRQHVGMWGHSMGGNLTLRTLEVEPQAIQAAVIWGGVVGSYDDLMNNWQRRVPFRPPPTDLALRNRYRQQLIATYGTPTSNPDFWSSIDPTAHLADIVTPMQLHTGGSDEEVPVAFSQSLFAKLQTLSKTVEYYNYPGGDHNISSPDFNLAMSRSLAFYNKYLRTLN